MIVILFMGIFKFYRLYSISVLIEEGKLCNFDRTTCIGGNWKTWEDSVFFLKKIPSLGANGVEDTPALRLL